METVPGGKPVRRAYSAATYVVLFVLGAAEGLVGSFQYAQPPAPLIAIVLAFLILLTCVFAGWGTMSTAGALVVGAGWILISFFMSMGTRQGSVIITNTAAGEWYLYGGALAVLLGALATFILRAYFRLRVRGGGH